MIDQITSEQTDYIKGVIEALLFVSERPVTLEQMDKVLETVGKKDVKNAIQILQTEYETRKCGMNIVEIADGYQMLSNPNYVNYVRKFYKTKYKDKLSKPALESLAIIAYKQPVTRLEVELIRGVNSDGVITHLVTKELIKIMGRKDIPGKPFLYGTTKHFLEYFGLKSLETLPKLEEFEKLKPVGEEESSGLTNQKDALQDGKEVAQSESSSEGQTQEMVSNLVGVATSNEVLVKEEVKEDDTHGS